MDIIKNIFANKRVKSFLWRTGMMCLAVIISAITEQIPFMSELLLGTTTTVLLGLFLGEMSKMINNTLQGR